MIKKREAKEKPDRFLIVFLIGKGSRLPNILNKILVPNSPIEVRLVVSHRKPEEGQKDVPGIAEAKRRGIPAIYWNLSQMRVANMNAFPGEPIGNVWLGKEGVYRQVWMRMLGAFLSQQYYRPKLIFMTGWDLVLDEDFMLFSLTKQIPILNVHPHPLPDMKDPQDRISAPDGTKIPVLRGTEVWAKTIEQKLPWSGVTIHKVVPQAYDVGEIITREWVRVKPEDTVKTLREKLNEVEDRIVPKTILRIARGEIVL